MLPPELIQCEPREVLDFCAPSGSSLLSCMVKVSNKTDSDVAFKVKVSVPKLYSMRPSAGVLQPRETRMVSIFVRQIPAEWSSHCFQVLAAQVPDGAGSLQWKELGAHAAQEVRLGVRSIELRGGDAQAGNSNTPPLSVAAGAEEVAPCLTSGLQVRTAGECIGQLGFDAWHGYGGDLEARLQGVEQRLADVEALLSVPGAPAATTAVGEVTSESRGNLAAASSVPDQVHPEEVRASSKGPAKSGDLRSSGALHLRVRAQSAESKNSVGKKSHSHLSLHFGDKAAGELLESVVEQSYSYKVNNTVYEALLLTNLPGLRVADSLTIVWGFSLNMCLQMLYVVVIFNAFLIKDVPEASHIQEWRAMEGHQPSGWGDVSLVSRVCRRDETLSVATGMVDMLGALSKYLEGGAGSFLTVAVVLTWLLYIGQEFRQCTFFFLALFMVPRAPHGETSLQVSHEGLLTFESLSARRRVILMITTVIRACFALVLGWVGALWLAHEANIRDLVLNAGALSFILCLDEIIFSEMLSKRIQTFVENLKPLPMHNKAVAKHACLAHAALLTQGVVLCGIFMSICILLHTSILPLRQQALDVVDSMCKRPLDFVYAYDRLGFLGGTRTDDPDEWVNKYHNGASMVQAAMQTMMDGKEFSNSFFRTFSDAHQLEQWSSARVRDTVAALAAIMRTRCTDYPFGSAGSLPVMSDVLRLELRDASVATCDDVRAYCGDEEQLLARTVCPSTCGCDRPRSGLLWAGMDGGCPTTLCGDMQAYSQALEQLPCEDESQANMRQSSAWAWLWKQWFARKSMDEPGITHDLVLAEGCPVLERLHGRQRAELCRGTTTMASVSHFCPRACGCASKYFSRCPIACANVTGS